MTDFEDIYKEYFLDVYKYVLSICHDAATAEEITQVTFFKAMRHISQFNGTCKLYVWLCQIAKNTYFSFLKKHKRIDPGFDGNFTDAAPGTETEYIDNETARRLHTMIHGLNEPYKEVFTLRVFGELPFSQIGELFGKTDSWARLIFHRAKKQLQEALK